MVNILWAAFSLMILLGLVKLIINAYRLVRIKYLHKEYKKYTEDLAQEIPNWNFVRRTTETKDLLEKSGVGTPTLQRFEAVGGGYGREKVLDVLDNMMMNDNEVATHMIHLFHMAEGAFSFRIIQSINPIYWLETVVFLPSLILEFVGISRTSSISSGKYRYVDNWSSRIRIFVARFLRLT